MSNLAICSSNWLDSKPVAAVAGTHTVGNSIANTTGGVTGTVTAGSLTWYGSPYYNCPWTPYYIPIYINSDRPIQLKMSEVEYLRKQAKTDKKLKEILQKFTDLIEITIDFE